jgi:hypothetical protein
VTGVEPIDQVAAVASHLVWAVREMDRVEVGTVLSAAGCSCACDHSRMHELVVMLAAMVPDDLSPSVLLAWLADPEGYLRLRERGVGAFKAMNEVRLIPREVA